MLNSTGKTVHFVLTKPGGSKNCAVSLETGTREER